MSFFEGAKVYAGEILIFILFILQIVSKEGFSFKRYNRTLLWCSGLLIGLTFYHLFFHQTETLFFGNVFRQQGTFLLWVLLLFAALSSRISIEQKNKPFLLIFVFFVQFICTVLFIGMGTDRPVGTLGEPNALAATIIILWPWLLFGEKKTVRLKIAIAISLIIALSILFLTGSRSGVIALGVQLSFLFIQWLISMSQGKSNRKSTVIAFIVSLLLLVISYSTPFIGPRTEYEDRGEIWKAAAIAGIAHPVFGIGFGNAEYELHTANISLGNKLTGYYVDSAHNIFLDWFIQAGIVGLFVFLFLLYKTAKAFLVEKQTRNSVILLGLLAALSFNPASIVSLITLWWLIGQGNSKHK